MKINKKTLTAALTMIQDNGQFEGNVLATYLIKKFNLEKEHLRQQKLYNKTKKTVYQQLKMLPPYYSNN